MGAKAMQKSLRESRLNRDRLTPIIAKQERKLKLFNHRCTQMDTDYDSNSAILIPNPDERH
jgi:hypothetical protein